MDSHHIQGFTGISTINHLSYGLLKKKGGNKTQELPTSSYTNFQEKKYLKDLKTAWTKEWMGISNINDKLAKQLLIIIILKKKHTYEEEHSHGQ